MADLTLSATDVKKSLKVLAVLSGSEDAVLPIYRDLKMPYVIYVRLEFCIISRLA